MFIVCMSNRLFSLFSREQSSDQRLRTSLENDEIDAKFGFEGLKENGEKIGYLMNMHTVSILDN
jgi:hypothetical protein